MQELEKEQGKHSIYQPHSRYCLPTQEATTRWAEVQKNGH